MSAPSLDVDVTGPDAIYANDLLGDVRITIESRNAETPLFIGIGPAGDVAKYLDGVGHTEVADFDVDPFKVTLRAASGRQTCRPIPPRKPSGSHPTPEPAHAPSAGTLPTATGPSWS